MIRNILRKSMPESVRKAVRYYIYDKGFSQRRSQARRVRKIRDRGHANVLFVASSMSMWRCQGIYEHMSRDRRFSVLVAIVPFPQYSGGEQERCRLELREYFSSCGVRFVDAVECGASFEEVIRGYDPDILFYPQNYSRLYRNCMDWENFTDRLICYNNYGLPTIRTEWTYNTQFSNLAWRHYHPTPLQLVTAKEMMDNNAFNVRIVGEVEADMFNSDKSVDPWKRINDGKSRKRIIFAPHFRIKGNEVLNRGAFLWTAELMKELAVKYRDKVQFVFKPHPRLRTELYGFPGWGKERTDDYYRFWETSYNTQIELGGFMDVFRWSDAMIHNCVSFTGEYMFTSNPVLYLTRNKEEICAMADDFGSKCLDLHYFADNGVQIENFVENIVLGGNDPLASSRKEFYDEYMIPPDTGNVAMNTYLDILKGLKFI